LFFALTSFFAGLRFLPLAEAIAVTFTAPLFVAALSGPLLGDQVGPRRWAAVIAGFFGTLVVLRPGTAAFQPEAMLLLGSALAFSLAMLLTRRMSRTESSVAMLTYSTLGAGIACLPFLVPVWRAPAGEDLWLFLMIGVVGGFGAYLAIVAHRYAPPVVVAPFTYTGLVWGLILGWLIWRELLEPVVWLGVAIIVVASLYVTHREAVLARRA
jgi:drug/metabolite transporter (DMT)-like permease